jgi:hypothetical protein
LAAGEVATAKKEERQAPPAPALDALKAFEGRTAALAKLKAALATAFGAEQPKAIVLIDELDRCRPDYAISYLETIKHIFDVHGIVFVLAVDEGQLRSAASVLFGSSLDFAEYFRKFSHRTVQLPKPEKAEITRLVTAYCDLYLKKESKRSCIMPMRYEMTENIASLFHGFGMRPRQIQEAFRVMGHALSVSPDKKLQIHWAFGSAMLFMAALRSYNSEAYSQLAQASMPLKQLSELIQRLGENANGEEWWFKILAAGMWNKHNWENEVLAVMTERGWVKVTETEKTQIRLVFGDFFQGWGGVDSYTSQHGLGRVHDRIERLLNFAN